MSAIRTNPEEGTMTNKFTNLDELFGYLKGGGEHAGPLDDLPTFGGVEPRDTIEIYSWDEDRLLLNGGCGWEIVGRDVGRWPGETIGQRAARQHGERRAEQEQAV